MQFQKIPDAAEEMKISEFNSAIAMLQRLNNLWLDTHRHRRAGNYPAWNGDLDSVWCELASDVVPGSDDDKTFNSICEEVGKTTPLRNWVSRDGFNGLGSEGNILMAKQYQALIKKEIFLRRLQNKQGKGTKYQDTIEDYMDDRW